MTAGGAPPVRPAGRGRQRTSLRLRLLAAIVVLNTAVIAVVGGVSWSLQQRWLTEQWHVFHNVLRPKLLLDDPGQLESLPIRRLLSNRTFDRYFSDLLFTNGSAPDLSTRVDLNPLGALQRDPETFPIDEVLDGIRLAMSRRDIVEAGGGICVPVLSGDRLTGGVWYLPLLPAPRQLELTSLAIPLLFSSLIFAVVVFVFVDRSLTQPLRRVGEAAGRVAEGDHSVRVPLASVASELDPLILSFNDMVERVANHRQELEHEVAQATEAAARRERALMQSSRLAAMGTLAAGIAHEINNPIGGMLNAVRRLLDRDDLDERGRTYLELVQEGLQRVGRTARRLLDFAPRPAEPQPFSLAQAVEGVRGLVEHRLDRQRVELAVDLEADLPELFGDRHEIEQVLLNLLLNSLDVVGDGGRIAVEGRRLADGRVELRVADDGPGAPPEVLARVFDPFFSAKGKAESTGLGMFISYSIVTSHDGEIEVDSAPGAGFTTTIRLPARRAPANGGERD